MGFNTEDNLAALRQGLSGLSKISDASLYKDSFFGAKIPAESLSKQFGALGEPSAFTKLEQLLILAMQPVVKKHADELSKRTALIIATTKGNIDCLSEASPFLKERSYLWKLGDILADFFTLETMPIVVSNACISGGLAVLTAQRLIQANHYDNAIVVAGDSLSKFTLSGFASFNAMSSKPCKPFSRYRDGINIGEASACVFVSKRESDTRLLGGATVNDANHISGPSRTGAGLSKAIIKTLELSQLKAQQVDYLSPHGTATRYNDAMEAKAFQDIGLTNALTNPIKGYYGHTLGASALIETIISKHALLNQEVYKSLGFDTLDDESNLTVTTKHEQQNLRYAMNTASGFGGCNMALLLAKC